MHLLVWLDDGLDDMAIARRAADQGVSVRALSPTYSNRSPDKRQGLILGFGGYPQDQMIAAARKLARIIEQGA
ncbi:hypothetical protein D3C86_1777770 [compost metagenome]